MQESFAVNNNINIKDNNKTTNGIYSIDVRSKLIITIITSLSAIIFSSIYAQIVILIASFIYAGSMKKSKVMVFTYLFVIFIMLIVIACLLIINSFYDFMQGRSYFAVMVPFMRMVTMVNVVLPLAFSTNIQSILTALKSFNLPFFIYLPIAVMVRFIPSFISDIKQIKESFSTRGVDTSIWETIKHPIKIGRYLFMPLLFRSLRTSEELGVAAELKGLGLNDNVVPYKKLTYTSDDFKLLFVFALIIITSALVQIYIEVPDSLRSIHR